MIVVQRLGIVGDIWEIVGVEEEKVRCWKEEVTWEITWGVVVEIEISYGNMLSKSVKLEAVDKLVIVRDEISIDNFKKTTLRSFWITLTIHVKKITL